MLTLSIDVLFSLENFQHNASWSSRNAKLTMPAEDGTLIEDVGSLGLSPGLFADRTVLGDFHQTFSLACRLLDSFSPKNDALSRAKYHEFNLSWTLNGYHRLRKVIVEWLHLLGVRPTADDESLSLQYLACLQRCCVLGSHSSSLLSSTSLVYTWCQCLREFLSLSILDRLPSVQALLSCFLDDLSRAAANSNPLVQQIKEALPALEDIESNHSNVQFFESHLWSSLRTLHSKLESSLVDVLASRDLVLYSKRSQMKTSGHQSDFVFQGFRQNPPARTYSSFLWGECLLFFTPTAAIQSQNWLLSFKNHTKVFRTPRKSKRWTFLAKSHVQ
jgi:serine/threonine-protein kinase ATR